MRENGGQATQHASATTRDIGLLACRYALPEELMAFLRSGFVEVLSKDKPRKTLYLHIPALRSVDLEGLAPAVQYRSDGS